MTPKQPRADYFLTQQLDRALTRRQMLLKVGAGVMAAMIPTLPGCGGGGTGPLSNAGLVRTSPATGSASLAEVGGDGLTVASAWAPQAPIQLGGGFATQCSLDGAQLISLVDDSGAPRALAVSTPSGLDNVTFDARSTATALLMMCYGILETSPKLCDSRIAEIEALPSFPGFVSMLAAHLSNANLTALMANDQVAALRAACVREWVAGQERARSRDIESEIDGGAWLEVGDRSDVTRTKLNACNRGLRFIAARKRLYGADQGVISTTDVGYSSGYLSTNVLMGAAPFSWGSIIAGTALSPTRFGELGTTDFHQTAQADYWVFGPGAREFEQPPPDLGIPAGLDRANGATLIAYGVFPALDFMLGCTKFLTGTKLIPAAFDVPLIYDALINISPPLATELVAVLTKGLDSPGAAAGFLNLVLKILPIMGAHPELLTRFPDLADLPARLTSLGDILTPFKVAIALLDLGLWVADLARMPKIACVRVNATGPGTIIVS